jgi:hypothetical protein
MGEVTEPPMDVETATRMVQLGARMIDRVLRSMWSNEGDQTAHTFGAFRTCNHDHAILYEAVMEAHGPAVVERVVRAGLAAGQLLENPKDTGCATAAHTVLVVLHDNGDVVCGYSIPHEHAFEWWRKAVELRATSSDCRVCEPAAYAATYAAVG